MIDIKNINGLYEYINIHMYNTHAICTVVIGSNSSRRSVAATVAAIVPYKIPHVGNFPVFLQPFGNPI